MQGGGQGAPLSEVFPTTKLLWNLVNGIYFVSSLNFQIPGQDGFKHVFDHCISHHSNYFSIILLLKKYFKGKNPNYLNYIIATGSNDFINLSLFN